MSRRWDMLELERRARRRRLALQFLAWVAVFGLSIAAWFAAIAGTLFVFGLWHP